MLRTWCNITDLSFRHCRLAQLVKDINCRTSSLSALENPSLSLSLENAAQCEAEIRQWLSDLPPAYRMEGEGVNEDSSSISTSTANHGGTPPTLLAQRLDILMTTQRLALGLYLPFLRPHSPPAPDAQSSAKLDASPQTHQARVGALTAAHVLIRAGRHYLDLACARPDLVRRKDGLGLSLCCGLVFGVHSGQSFSSSLAFSSHHRIGFEQGVEKGYSRALFDACVVCASSALRDPSAVWTRTAVDDAKAGLALLRDLRDLSPARDVSVVEALIRKLESGSSSGSGTGSKRKRDGRDEGEGRDAIAVPGGETVEESVSLVPVPASVSSQEFKLHSPPPNINATPSASTNAPSSTHEASKDKSCSEPKRAYPTLAIPSKLLTAKDRLKDRYLSKDGQRERDRDCSRGDKEKDPRKKAPYPPVGFRVRPRKETSPLIRGQSESVAPEAQGPRTAAQGMLATPQSSTIMTPSVSMSNQSMSISGQSMPATQLTVMSQPPSAVPPLRPPSLVSTPIDQPSYRSTPTPMSQDGGVDFSLPFGAAYETQSQVCPFTVYIICSLSHTVSVYSKIPLL